MANDDKARPSDAGDRRTQRRRVLMTGLVAYNDLAVSFRCTIRDRSTSGARLKLPGGAMVPPRFWVIDVAEGLAFDATVAWRRYPEVGVSTGEPLNVRVVGDDSLHRRLHALWLEIAPRG